MYSLALLASFGKLKNKKTGDFCPEILSNIDICSIDLYVKVFFSMKYKNMRLFYKDMWCHQKFSMMATFF